ncbi:hypothetical protein HAX54_048417 [Datura stramonium]|uniref:Uncharacterized protein n=1 Tax=Datura stramonium TaxID=4076 RepID=A0ABS8SU27_DATST|nr:hypothetical protein [Datura stramonium]
MPELETLITFRMKLLTLKIRFKWLELMKQPQPTILGPLLGNELLLPSLVREMSLQKIDLLRMASEGLTTLDRGHLKRSIAEKIVPEVFGPSGQTTRTVGDTIDASGVAIGLDLAFITALLPTSTPPTSGVATVTQGKESTETSSTAPQTSHYAFTPSIFAEKLGSFVDRAILATLVPYESLHARIDDMEEQERLPQAFPILTIEELDEEEPFINLLGKYPKTLEEDLSLEELQAHISGASSSSVARVADQTCGAMISSDSQTFITLPPATEVAPDDTLSASVTTSATVYIPGITTP